MWLCPSSTEKLEATQSFQIPSLLTLLHLCPHSLLYLLNPGIVWCLHLGTEFHSLSPTKPTAPSFSSFFCTSIFFFNSAGSFSLRFKQAVMSFIFEKVVIIILIIKAHNVSLWNQLSPLAGNHGFALHYRRLCWKSCLHSLFPKLSYYHLRNSLQWLCPPLSLHLTELLFLRSPMTSMLPSPI